MTQEIVVTPHPQEQYEEFEIIKDNDLEAIGRNKLIPLILTSGLWPLLKELPYRDLARPELVGRLRPYPALAFPEY